MSFREHSIPEKTKLLEQITAVRKEIAEKQSFLEGLEQELKDGCYVCAIDWQ